jgi:hypothetical protein
MQQPFEDCHCSRLVFNHICSFQKVVKRHLLITPQNSLQTFLHLSHSKEFLVQSVSMVDSFSLTFERYHGIVILDGQLETLLMQLVSLHEHVTYFPFLRAEVLLDLQNKGSCPLEDSLVLSDL